MCFLAKQEKLLDKIFLQEWTKIRRLFVCFVGSSLPSWSNQTAIGDVAYEYHLQNHIFGWNLRLLTAAQHNAKLICWNLFFDPRVYLYVIKVINTLLVTTIQ